MGQRRTSTRSLRSATSASSENARGRRLRSTWSLPKPSAAVPTPEAGGKSQQDGTRRGATVRDPEEAGGCPAASPHNAAGKARLRGGPDPETHPTRGHSRAEAVFTREDCASNARTGRRERASSGRRRHGALHCRHRSASPRRWPPQAPAPPWTGPFSGAEGRESGVRRGAANLSLKGNRQARFCGRD